MNAVSQEIAVRVAYQGHRAGMAESEHPVYRATQDPRAVAASAERKAQRVAPASLGPGGRRGYPARVETRVAPVGTDCPVHLVTLARTAPLEDARHVTTEIHGLRLDTGSSDLVQTHQSTPGFG